MTAHLHSSLLDICEENITRGIIVFTCSLRRTRKYENLIRDMSQRVSKDKAEMLSIYQEKKGRDTIVQR